MTSSATNSEGVWTHTPSSTARRINAGKPRVNRSHSSGNRTMARSCTVTTRAALLDGGTTKLVPWTTWCDPMNHSTGGWDERFQATCSGRAGMARCEVDTPEGARSEMACRRLQLMANAETSRSDREASPPSAPAQNAPTPVGRPKSGVASRATDSRPWSAIADRSVGTR